MTDLISRQAAIDALNDRCEAECEYSKKQRSVMCGACYLGSAIEVIEELPTIDPVKHGKWERKWHSAFKTELPCCSECERFSAMRWNYCPNCGSKNGGEG